MCLFIYAGHVVRAATSLYPENKNATSEDIFGIDLVAVLYRKAFTHWGKNMLHIPFRKQVQICVAGGCGFQTVLLCQARFCLPPLLSLERELPDFRSVSLPALNPSELFF